VSTWIGSFAQRLLSGVTNGVRTGMPYWLQGPDLGTYMQSVGAVLDQGREELRQGLDLSRPLQCDVSALSYLSTDRTITLWPAEPIVAQRQALISWLDIHRQAGTAIGVMRRVQNYFLTSIGVALPTIRHVSTNLTIGVSDWWTLDGTNPDPTTNVSRYASTSANWNWDGENNWPRWWLIIYVPATYPIAGVTLWDDGHLWDGGQVWDGLLTSQQYDDLLGICADPHIVCGAMTFMGLIFTALTPTTPIPDLVSGGPSYPFDPASSSAALTNGGTSLPTGSGAGDWSNVVDPATNLPTRPQWATFVLPS
jgi:Phage tail protein (Tail_P2_I)